MTYQKIKYFCKSNEKSFDGYSDDLETARAEKWYRIKKRKETDVVIIKQNEEVVE